MNKIDVLKFNNERKNMVYGPYSIQVALSMLDEGATEATKESLDLFLNGSSINKYNNIEKVLSTANKMYVKICNRRITAAYTRQTRPHTRREQCRRLG